VRIWLQENISEPLHPSASVPDDVFFAQTANELRMPNKTTQFVTLSTFASLTCAPLHRPQGQVCATGGGSVNSANSLFPG
jgi:hypothetical protein